MFEYERKVIEEEIGRLERAWERAQERYSVTGSRSTDRTMTRHRIIQEALENALTDNRAQALERAAGARLTKLMELRGQVQKLAEAGRLTAAEAGALERIIMREE